VSTRNENKW
jgi:hypothetical protein